MHANGWHERVFPAAKMQQHGLPPRLPAAQTGWPAGDACRVRLLGHLNSKALLDRSPASPAIECAGFDVEEGRQETHEAPCPRHLRQIGRIHLDQRKSRWGEWFPARPRPRAHPARLCLQ